MNTQHNNAATPIHVIERRAWIMHGRPDPLYAVYNLKKGPRALVFFANGPAATREMQRRIAAGTVPVLRHRSRWGATLTEMSNDYPPRVK